MTRSTLAAIIMATLLSFPAIASPPPAGSNDDKDLSQWSDWFNQQRSKGGYCCSIADGRVVDVKIHDGHYWVRFLWPQDINMLPAYRPEPGKWYEVADGAVLRGDNPTGYPIAWWSSVPIIINGENFGHIRCFIMATMS